MNTLRGRRGMRRSLRLGAALAVMLLALSACSGSKSKSNAKSTTSTTKPAVVTKVSDAPRTANYVGARKDVTDLTCTQDGKLWKVGGKVNNPTTAPADYRIFTSFLDQANVTRGLLQTDIKGLAPKETRPWSGELELAATGLKCGLRVERTGVNGAPPPTETPTSKP